MCQQSRQAEIDTHFQQSQQQQVQRKNSSIRNWVKNCEIATVNSKVLAGHIQIHRYVKSSKKVKVDMQMPLFVQYLLLLLLFNCSFYAVAWLDVTNNNNSHTIIYALWECKRAFPLLSWLLLLICQTAHNCTCVITCVCTNLLMFFGECGKWHSECFAFMGVLLVFWLFCVFAFRK